MFCTKCGSETKEGVDYCGNCGNSNNKNLSESNSKSVCSFCKREFNSSTESLEHERFCQLNPNSLVKAKVENSSGMGDNSVLPDELKGWSWGGFLWGWIWSIGNRTWIGLLAIVPYIGFIMNIVLGVKGREWAWKNKRWNDVEHFKKIQKRWVIWWLILGIFSLLAILSVALLATINPIEQTNKARDAEVMNNSAELLNAFERYYAINSRYPWQQNANSNKTQLSEINNATWMESIYSAGELKDSFRNNLSIPEDKYTLYSNGVDNYVCFNPKSKDRMEQAKSRCFSDSKISNTELCNSSVEQICVPE